VIATITFSGKDYLIIGAPDFSFLFGKSTEKVSPSLKRKSVLKLLSESLTSMMKLFNLTKTTRLLRVL
jgi:hypothetical protein